VSSNVVESSESAVVPGETDGVLKGWIEFEKHVRAHGGLKCLFTDGEGTLDITEFKSQLQKLAFPLGGEQSSAIFAVLLKHHQNERAEAAGDEDDGEEDDDEGEAVRKSGPLNRIELLQSSAAMDTINGHLNDVYKAVAKITEARETLNSITADAESSDDEGEPLDAPVRTKPKPRGGADDAAAEVKAEGGSGGVYDGTSGSVWSDQGSADGERTPRNKGISDIYHQAYMKSTTPRVDTPASPEEGKKKKSGK